MPFTMLYGCGFEMGTRPMDDADVSNITNVTVSSTFAKSGTYSLRTDSLNNWARAAVTGTPASCYAGIWVYLTTNNYTAGSVYIRALLSTGQYIDLRWNNATRCWDAYVNGVLVESGTVSPQVGWHHVQIYFFIDNAGSIQTKIDGVNDIIYNGDTQPGASAEITYIYLWSVTLVTDRMYWDNFVIGTGDWPGDMRADGLVPNADTATKQWLRSAGVDNYALVDEVPASDADYVYTETTAHQDLYELSDWDDTDKTPLAVVQWCRAQKSEAAAHQLKLLLRSGATLSTGAAEDLVTNWKYLSRIFETDPATGAAWTDACSPTGTGAWPAKTTRASARTNRTRLTPSPSRTTFAWRAPSATVATAARWGRASSSRASPR